MNKQKWTVLVVTLAVVAVTAGFLVRLRSMQRLGEPGLKLLPAPSLSDAGRPVGTNSVCFPEFVLDFKSRPGVVTTNELNWLPQDTTYGRREYVATDGFRAILSAVLMGTDRTSIHKPQICLVGQGWKIERTETVLIPIDRPHRYLLPAKKMIGSKLMRGPNGTTEKVMVIYLYWFVAKDRLTSEHGQRMWWMAEHLVRTGELQRWAYVSCTSACPPGQEAAAFNRMKELLAASVPDFQLAAGEATVAAANHEPDRRPPN